MIPSRQSGKEGSQHWCIARLCLEGSDLWSMALCQHEVWNIAEKIIYFTVVRLPSFFKWNLASKNMFTVFLHTHIMHNRPNQKIVNCVARFVKEEIWDRRGEEWDRKKITFPPRHALLATNDSPPFPLTTKTKDSKTNHRQNKWKEQPLVTVRYLQISAVLSIAIKVRDMLPFVLKYRAHCNWVARSI